MNFKRMIFLLIMLALVLLVGIGSVSAASDDGTDIISDGITDDMLLDDGVTENTDPSDPTEPGDSTDPVAEKINTTVESANVTARDNETASISVAVKDNESKNITVAENDFSVSEGDKSLNFTYNGTINLVDKLDLGNHTLIIAYLGNDTYSSSKMNIIVNVRGEFAINTNVTSIDVNSTKKGEFKINNISNGVDFKEFTKDDLNITVSYKDGNQTKSINVTSFDLADGVISFVLENGNFTNATLTISYNNDEVVSNITLHRIYNARIEVINNENDFLSGNFTYKLIDIDDENEILANKSVTFVSDESFEKKVGTITSSNPIRMSAQTDSEGILNFKNSNLKPVHYAIVNGSFMIVYGDNFNIGTHNVTLKAGDNLKFDDFKTNVIINKLSIIITPKAFSEYYGTDKKFQIEVRNAITNELVSGLVLKLDIPQTTGKTYYVSTNDDGIGEIGVNKLVGGTYNVGITNNDTDNINSTVNNTTLTIKKIPVKIDTSSKTMYYNSGSTAKIKITNSKTGKAVAGVYVFVRLYTSSTKYNDYLFMTNSKGVVEFSAPLDVGKHKMIVATADTRYSCQEDSLLQARQVLCCKGNQYQEQ